MPFPVNALRILGTEFGERFGYYSLRAVLTLYFLSLGFDQGSAVALFAFTSALTYCMPLLGGILADVALGKFRTILLFSLVYIAGALALALNAALGGGAPGALLALVAIAVGTGGIKPCVFAFGAEQLPEGQEALRSRFFAGFYVAINCGSTLAFLLAPMLRAYFGFGAAFGAAAAVLGVAVAVFAAGHRSYRHVPPAPAFYRGAAAYVRRAARQRLGFRGVVAPGTQLQEKEDVHVEAAFAAVKRVLPKLALMPCFWALFNQQGSSWVLQAKDMRRKGVLPFGLEASPEALIVINPVLVTVLVPALTRLFASWPRLFGRAAPPPLRRICCGMLLASLSFLWSAVLQLRVDALGPGSVSVLWQVPQFVLITLAEVLVAVMLLDYIYGESPEEARSAVQALSLLTVSVGDLLCGCLYEVLAPRLGLAQLLLTCSALMLVNALAFFRVAWGGPATPAAADGTKLGGSTGPRAE